MMAWTPLALPGLVALALGGAMAFAVYAAAPVRPANRRLALMLAAEAVVVGAAGGLNPLMTDPADAMASRGLHVVSFLAAPLLYLWFIGTLETPLVRPFKHPLAQRSLPVLALLAPLLYFAQREAFVAGIEPGVAQAWAGVYGPAYTWLRIAGTVSFLYGLVAAADVVRRHRRDTPTGRRARSYLAAFLVHDIGFSVLLFYALPRFNETRSGFWEGVVLAGPALVGIAFILLMAYGILRTQLFDIDLRLKWTLRQSTLAGLFIAGFFTVSEFAAQLMQDSVGRYLGIAAAGLLVFALAPLQRVAERVANAALPGVEPTPEYLAYKKLEVYRAAVESAQRDGLVTDRERDVLDTLRAKLGIAPPDAARVEAEVAGGG